MAHLSTARMKAAEYERREYVVTVEHGVTIEDVQKPAFWQHVAAKLRPWDHIEVRADDESFYAELLVRSMGKGWAVVSLLSHVELAKKEPEAEPGADFLVKWGGPHNKHQVIRVADNVLMSKGHGSAADAHTWIAEHRKALA